MRIYIIGMPAAGKSTYGRSLASRRGMGFVDLDDLIVEREKMSIPKLFETVGEYGFRLVEHSALLSTIGMHNVVIACGGGTPCFGDNMQIMNKNGETIWLKCAIPELVRRIRSDSNKRPLLSDIENIEEYLKKLLSMREEYYSLAQKII
ncbi:MAG: shikimate kinase [Paludibacteraceae bacterium]|nr:shikimate kinase [Paludibacteraceae bacterium]